MGQSKSGFMRRGINVGYFSDGQIRKNCNRESNIEHYLSGDIVGLGVNILKGQIFFTKNGKLSNHVISVPLMASVYPMVCCMQMSTAFKVNFGKTPFKFELKGYFGRECNKVIQNILSLSVKKEEVSKLIASYLYLNGCQKSLAYFEELSRVQREDTLQRLKQVPSIHSMFRTKSLNSSVKSLSSTDEVPNLNKTTSGPAGTTTPAQLTTASEGLFKGFRKKLKSFFSTDAADSPKKDKDPGDGSTEGSTHKSTSQVFDAMESPSSQIWQAIETLSYSDETAFIERTRIKQHLLKNDIHAAELTCQTSFKALYDTHSGIRALFKALQFIQLFQECPRQSVEYAKANFTPELQKEKIEFTKTGAMTVKLELKELLGLLVTKDPLNSRFKFLFTSEFRAFSADMLNSCILCRF